MNYLKIINTGVIEPEDLTLLGSSTKRGDDTQIGMFGTGLKLGLPYFLRNDIDFKIFAGLKELKVDTEVVLHRDTPVRVVVVDGQKTSITTEAGIKWTGWMAIREVVSNAIDAGNYKITTVFNPEEFKGKDENSTVFYIAMNKELSNVIMNFDRYFTFNKEADYVTEDNTKFYIKKEQSSLNVYRKGIRCLDSSRKTLIDIDFNDLEISDDRLVSENDMDEATRHIIRTEALPIKVFIALLRSEYAYFLPHSANENIVNMLKELLDAGYSFTCGYLISLGMLLTDEETRKETCIVIPNTWHTQLTRLGLVESPFKEMNLDSGVPNDFIRTDNVNIYKIKNVLKRIGLDYLNIGSGIWKSMTTKTFYHKGVYFVKDVDNIHEDEYVELAANVCSILALDDWLIRLNQSPYEEVDGDVDAVD